MLIIFRCDDSQPACPGGGNRPKAEAPRLMWL
jgi:hypothetical protein